MFSLFSIFQQHLLVSFGSVEKFGKQQVHYEHINSIFFLPNVNSCDDAESVVQWSSLAKFFGDTLIAP